MPTYRKLHTKVLESQDLADMPDDLHRLTWLLLPLILSREGTTIYQAHYLCSKLYPLRADVTDARVGDVFVWYERRGMIASYSAGGRRYLWVPTFERYQGDCDKEGASQFPPVPDLVRQAVLTNSVPTLEQVKTNSALDVDVDSDSDVDAKTKAAAAPPLFTHQPRRVIDHETTPESELLRLLHQAFQRGTGQTVTEALPTGNAKAALRQLLDDDRSADDIDACARYLKAGWWHDKTLTIPKLAESIGQWIAQGRPPRPATQARASPDAAHQSPALAAFREFQQQEEASNGNGHHADSGDAGLGVPAGEDRGSYAGGVPRGPG